MKLFKKKRMGISLVEIICAMAMLSLITLAAVQLLQIGALSNVTATREFDVQSGGRIAMETMTNKIRYSTAVFVVPESGFREDNLGSGWDYVGVLETDNGQKELVSFEYVKNTATGSWYHKKTVLLAAQENFMYDLQFKKLGGSDKSRLIEYFFTIYQNGEKYWELGSEAEAMNSLQVVDWGTNSDKGRAIAFQSTDREMEKTIGRVALVLDVSGSMGFSFDGRDNGSYERRDAMRRSALELLDTFAEYDNIEVTIIPYSTTADFPNEWISSYRLSNYQFFNVQSNYSMLSDMIKKLNADGGTNTGDGLRRAYHSFLENDSETVRRTADYVILLSDGDMTMATMEALAPYNSSTVLTVSNVVDRTFYTSLGNVPNKDYGELYGYSSGAFNAATGEVNRTTVSGWITNDYRYYSRQYVYNLYKGCIYGIGATSANGINYAIDVYSKGYVQKMGDILKSYDVTPYFVAVSSSVSTKGIEIVKDSLGISDEAVYNPLNQDELLSAFESIGDAIVNDLWFIDGPAW